MLDGDNIFLNNMNVSYNYGKEKYREESRTHLQSNFMDLVQCGFGTSHPTLLGIIDIPGP